MLSNFLKHPLILAASSGFFAAIVAGVIGWISGGNHAVNKVEQVEKLNWNFRPFRGCWEGIGFDEYVSPDIPYKMIVDIDQVGRSAEFEITLEVGDEKSTLNGKGVIDSDYMSFTYRNANNGNSQFGSGLIKMNGIGNHVEGHAVGRSAIKSGFSRVSFELDKVACTMAMLKKTTP